YTRNTRIQRCPEAVGHFNATRLVNRFSNYPYFALTHPYHLTKSIEQGAIVEQLTHVMRARRPDIFQDLRHEQMYSFLLQSPVKRAYRLGSRVIYVVHRGSIDAKPT